MEAENGEARFFTRAEQLAASVWQARLPPYRVDRAQEMA